MSVQESAVDLIILETETFILHIKGKPIHPRVNKIYEGTGDNYQALLQITHSTQKPAKFKCYDPQKDVMQSMLDEDKNIKRERIYPVFYEEQDYQIYIEGKGSSDISFYHDNILIRDAVSSMPNKDNILWGNINFRSDVGYSELVIEGQYEILLKLKIEVFPTKIDYRHDYNQLLKEVNQEVYNLAYDFLRRTFQGMNIKEADKVSDVEFFQILQAVFTDFMKAFHRIQRSPHHRLQQTKEVLPASRVKKTNRQSIKWLKKNLQYYDQKRELPVKMLNIDKQISFNTFENKFVKWIVFQLIKKLTNFKESYRKAKNDEKVDQQLLDKIDNMIGELDYLIYHTFLEEVGELHKIDSLTLVLQMAPGYKEIYRYYLMLLKGLSLEGELTRLSMKQLWRLYEYWCYLKLNRILKENEDKYRLVKSNLIDVDYLGIYVTLNTGHRAEVKYENKETGECFSLIYNHKYSNEREGITTAQKPDNILSLEKKDLTSQDKVEYKFVFDAKYRLDPGDEKKYGPGPEEDTINTMHRYRDAIVSRDKSDYSREMVGAYVLFPYDNEEKFKNHPYYKSIEKVNVGAFPFLPDHTDLVKEFLDNIIQETSLGNFERNVLPQGTEDYQQTIKFKQDVMVGSLRGKEQLEYCKENNLYYIPYNSSLLQHNLKYVALYQSKEKFNSNSGIKYYGIINNIEIKQRSEINTPYSSGRKDKKYIIFQVNEWQELKQSIQPEGYGVRRYIYTNYMLLKKADTLPELSLQTVKQWRIWLELKRMKKEIKVKLANYKIDDIDNIAGFEIDGIRVKIKGEKIITDNNKYDSEDWTYQDFLNRPRKVLKELISYD